MVEHLEGVVERRKQPGGVVLPDDVLAAEPAHLAQERIVGEEREGALGELVGIEAREHLAAPGLAHQLLRSAASPAPRRRGAAESARATAARGRWGRPGARTPGAPAGLRPRRGVSSPARRATPSPLSEVLPQHP